MLNALAFFRLVPPLPRMMTFTFVITTIASMLVVSIDPRWTRSVLLAIAFLQLFAAASGFARPARRGDYHRLLRRGDTRLVTGIAQWCMSVAAGVASWVAVAGVEIAATGAPVRSFAPGTVTAMFLVSTIPWATTVALPRFAGAVGWLAVMVMATTLAPQLGRRGEPWWVEACAVLLLPGSFVGVRFSTTPLVATPALLCAVIAVVAALRWIDGADIPRETAY
jgi:hypothetical protein